MVESVNFVWMGESVNPVWMAESVNPEWMAESVNPMWIGENNQGAANLGTMFPGLLKTLPPIYLILIAKYLLIFCQRNLHLWLQLCKNCSF